MMDRRRFISGVTLGLLAAPLGAEAQHAGKVWRIGYTAIGPRSGSDPALKLFSKGCVILATSRAKTS